MSKRRRKSALAHAIDQREPRERLLLVVATLLALLAGWFYLVFQPLQERGERLATERQGVEAEITVLEMRREDLLSDIERDMNAEKRETIAELEEELASLQERIAGRMPDFIEPDRMRSVLEGMLEAESGIELVRLERLPPVRVVEASGDEQPVAVYRHAVRVVVESGYRDIIDYLRAVEDLPWQFSWSHLEYEVIDHPKARVTMEIHTFGGQEAWLGV